MRCYNGCIPESDYRARYGYSQYDYDKLREANPRIIITYFPIEGKYDACVPSEGYRSLGDMCYDKMESLKQGIKLLEVSV